MLFQVNNAVELLLISFYVECMQIFYFIHLPVRLYHIQFLKYIFFNFVKYTLHKYCQHLNNVK